MKQKEIFLIETETGTALANEKKEIYPCPLVNPVPVMNQLSGQMGYSHKPCSSECLFYNVQLSGLKINKLEDAKTAIVSHACISNQFQVKIWK